MVIENRKTFAGIDLLKFVMALMIVAIHVKPFENSVALKMVFQPWLTAAVPVFFLISAFLLFRKLTAEMGGVKTNFSYCYTS